MNFIKLTKTKLTAYTGYFSSIKESWSYIVKKCRVRIHIANNIVQVTGEHSHVPNPGKIEVKQAVTAARSRSIQSRDAPRVITQETQATLSQEVVAEMLSYFSMQVMM